MAAWAGYIDARLADDAKRWDRLELMARDSSWTKRLLSLVGVQSMPIERQRALAGILASDKDIIVRGYAASLNESNAASGAATKPTGGN